MPPYDLWNEEVIARIRDRSTIDIEIHQKGFSFGIASYDVFFTSNQSANFFDAKAPYTEHNNEVIRIHGFLTVPSTEGPHPAFVIGHGHGGSADLFFAQQVALLGYVALYIDGPQAGQSVGGPIDDNQAWISVDKGPQYSYLYHYAYAGMRALTLLEDLADQPGNPYRIDPNKLGALGASMGGILTTYLNGIDSRIKAAIIMASAGNWAHTLRYPNSWLYHGLYAYTRDQPFNGSDPLNSVEDIDRDPTAINFLNYFDPIRYAPKQYAPNLTIIGTHDGYFPLPNPNLMLQTIASAGKEANFEKRLWLIPNAPHDFATALDISEVANSLREFVNYAFGRREKPLNTPIVEMSETGFGLRFRISLAETTERLNSVKKASLYAATRVDSTKIPINDFREYPASREGDLFFSQISLGEESPAGDVITAENVIYFATVIDEGGLAVSSLVSKGAMPMDLSTDFTPVIDHYPEDNIVVPLPPPSQDAAETISSSIAMPAIRSYQGIALSNPTDSQRAVRIEARTPEGRIAAAEGLINPIYLSLPPRNQQVFLHEEWFGSGSQLFNGSLRAFWTDAPPVSLFIRGSVDPSEIVEIGPAAVSAKNLWLPLVPEQDPAAMRRIRIFGGSALADVQIVYRDSSGSIEQIPYAQVEVPANGTVDVTPPLSMGAASAEIQATNPVSAQLEVSGAKDPWSIEARTPPDTTRYFLPHTQWNGTFTMQLLILNPSGDTRQIQSHLRTQEGIETASSSITLDPFAVANITIESLFLVGSSEAGVGWVDIESPDGPVLIAALAMNPMTGAIAASAVGTACAGSHSMPYYVETPGYWTGLAIVNVGYQPSDIVITAWDRTGSMLKQWAANLDSQKSKALLIGEWIQGLPPETSGQIIITSSEPVALLAYIGTDDAVALAAIPFTIISP